MSYEYELEPLLNWVKDHPGLSTKGLEESIQAIPWPPGDPKSWNPPYEGTRLSKSVPATNSLKWKLRYLELSGLVKTGGRSNQCWFAT